MTYAYPEPHRTVHCCSRIRSHMNVHPHAPQQSPLLNRTHRLSPDRSCEATAARMFESQCACIVGSTELVRSSWPMRSSAAYKAHIASSCSLSFVCALTASHCGRSRRESKMQLTPCGNMSLRLRAAALRCTQWSSRLLRHSRSLQLAAVLTGRRTLAAVRPPVRRHSAAGRVDLHATASAIGGMCGPSGQRSNGAAQRV